MSSAPSVRAANPSETDKRPVAVIDIGATSVRMAIAEIDSCGNIRTLETLSQAVSLGKDTLRSDDPQAVDRRMRSRIEKLSQATARVRHYAPEQMRVVATSAVREAMNRLAFLDRIFIATGMVVEPLDEAEVNRITYMGIQPLLKADP